MLRTHSDSPRSQNQTWGYRQLIFRQPDIGSGTDNSPLDVHGNPDSALAGTVLRRSGMKGPGKRQTRSAG
jgi:hypothetical protein